MKHKVKEKYEYTNVLMPKPLKQEIRFVAAGMETSIGDASMQLIRIGLEEYKHQISAKKRSRETATTCGGVGSGGGIGGQDEKA